MALAWQKNLEIKEEQMSIRVNTCEEHDNCFILFYMVMINKTAGMNRLWARYRTYAIPIVGKRAILTIESETL